MTCVDMEEPLTSDQEEDTEPPPQPSMPQKGTSNKDLVQTVFDYIDNQKVDELRNLCKKWRVLKRTLNNPPAETPLHRAVRKGFVDCLMILLETKSNIDDLEVPDDKGQTALLTAVANTQPEALKTLLLAGANINARGDNHYGALHLLVQALSKNSAKGEEQHRLLEVTDLLLSSTHVNKLDLEPHADLVGLTDATPLAIAAAKLKQDDTSPWIPRVLELCKKLVKAGASLLADAGGTTVEHVLNQKECMSEELLQRQQKPPTRPTVAHVVDVVCMGGSGDKVKEVLQGKPEEVRRKAVNSRLGSHSLLFHAVDAENTSLVRFLLQNGAKPWRTEATLELPLHHAVRKNNEEIFKLITENMREGGKYLYLGDYSVSLFIQSAEMERNGQGACFHHLLQECDPKTMAAPLNEDAMSENVLSILVFYLYQKELSKKKNYDIILDLVMPATLERAMDNCITLSDKDDILQLDYRFFLPQDEYGLMNELELPMRWCHSQQHYQAIKHPLMRILLTAKRQKVQRFNVTCVLSHLLFTTLFTYLCYRKSLFGAGWIFVLLMVELCQYWILWNFREWYMLLGGAVKVFLMLLMLVPIFNRDELVVWSIVFVWYDFVMVLGRFPLVNKYVTALHIVTKTFLWLIFVYGGLIAAFACSFFIILAPPGNSNISDFWNMVVSTLVMSLGEFEYSSFSEQLHGVSAHLLFIVFLFFIVLVVMNVMNSLAVTDIEESVRMAEFKKLKAQLETLYTLESFCMVISRLCPKLNYIRVFEPKNRSSLQAKICLSDSSKQLQSKTNDMIIGTLDNDTIRCLRSYRTQQMQHKQIGIAAKDLVTHHPEVVKTLAAALCSKPKWNISSSIE